MDSPLVYLAKWSIDMGDRPEEIQQLLKDGLTTTTEFMVCLGVYQNVVDYAIDKGRIQVIKLFLRAITSYSRRDQCLKRCLDHVIFHDPHNVLMFKTFLAYIKDINLFSLRAKCDFLSRAVSNQRYRLIDILLRKGCSLNLNQHNTTTPLTAAIRAEEFDIAKDFLRRGANVNIITEGGSPLYAACALPQPSALQIIKHLLAMGADPNVYIIPGSTLWFSACFHGYTELVTVLLAYGADPTLVSRSGNSPSMLWERDPKLKEIFLNRPFSLQYLCFVAIEREEIRKSLQPPRKREVAPFTMITRSIAKRARNE